MDKGITSPLVSVVCNTYNHVNYIRQCLDGFLIQETNFPIEILVHDDASTDGTADIVREYEAKYPELIKPIYQTENQYSKGVKVTLEYQYVRAMGKYVALCEGDDYWTDPLKLQKQVDFLELHPDFVMVSHCTELYYQKDAAFRSGWKPDRDMEYQKIDLINGYWYFAPLTVVFRRDCLDINDYSRYPISMDAVLFYHLLSKGKGFLFEKEMGVYRVHDGGVWSGINEDKKIETEFVARLGIYEADPCCDSALFIKSQFFRPMSRRWMLKNVPLLKRSINIMARELGLWVTLKAIIKSCLISRK